MATNQSCPTRFIGTMKPYSRKIYQATIMMSSIRSLCLPGTGWEKTWPPCFWRNSGTCWVSEWASPIVPVLKSDSKYVVTSNRLLTLSPFLTTHSSSSRESEDSCEGPHLVISKNFFKSLEFLSYYTSNLSSLFAPQYRLLHKDAHGSGQ